MLPSWNQTKTGSKKGFDTVWAWSDKLGAPVNRLTNKIGSEAFWPMTLDKESDKAARILKSFCKDGFYAEEEYPSQDGPKQKQKVLKKIPQKVIQNAVGLAIFTTMRSGLWISGAGGSGVLIARLEDGSWSPPSGILLHTAGLGFLVGVDIYDCVLVINSRKTLESFTHIRATLGGEISAVAGPVGVGGLIENDGKWKQANKPVFTYLKSRGFYAGIQVDGTVIIERTDENERFYGQRISATDILAGKARHAPYEIKMLMETIKAAEGRGDVDMGMMEELADQPAPGDVDVEAPTAVPGPVFGIPEIDDPDPFGVLALEQIGLEIREAGTKSRPDSGQFSYNPSPTSPIYTTFHRRSMDTINNRSNRGSLMSMLTTGTNRTSVDRSMLTSHGTQTDDDLPSSPRLSKIENRRRSSPRIAEEEPIVSTPDGFTETDFTKSNRGPYHNESGDSANNSYSGSTVIDESPRTPFEKEHGEVKHDFVVNGTAENESEAEDEYEEPVIYEAAKAQTANPATLTPQVVNVVSIAKRIPPALPPRCPRRGQGVDQASGRSSTETDKRVSLVESNGRHSDGFDEVDLNGDGHELHVESIVMADREKEETEIIDHYATTNGDGLGFEKREHVPISVQNDENAMPGGW